MKLYYKWIIIINDNTYNTEFLHLFILLIIKLMSDVCVCVCVLTLSQRSRLPTLVGVSYSPVRRFVYVGAYVLHSNMHTQYNRANVCTPAH